MTIYEEHIKALEFYRDQIPQWANEKYVGRVIPTNFSEMEFPLLTKREQLCHCVWMTEEMLRMIKKENGNIAIDKIARWTGFIQGVIIVHGLTSIANERERTRPWFKKESTNV